MLIVFTQGLKGGRRAVHVKFHEGNKQLERMLAGPSAGSMPQPLANPAITGDDSMKKSYEKWMRWGRTLPPPARWILAGILVVAALYFAEPFAESFGERVGRMLYWLTH